MEELKLLRFRCKKNVLEYIGDGWIQCVKSANCPKSVNNRILGFDCLLFCDALPIKLEELLVSENDSQRSQACPV